MEKFKNYLILALFLIIGILLLIKGCGNSNGGSTNIIKKDTITVTKVIDRPYEVIKFKPIYYPKADTITKIDTVIDARLCQFERTYADSLSDTNLTIYSNIKAIGLLKSNNLSYRLKVPLKVETIKEITLTQTKTPKISLYTGLELAGNQTSFNASPFITLNINKASLTAGYGLIDKTYKIGVGYRLFKSKK